MRDETKKDRADRISGMTEEGATARAREWIGELTRKSGQELDDYIGDRSEQGTRDLDITRVQVKVNERKIPTPAEIKVLDAISLSKDQAEAAAKLFISRNTLRDHLKSVKAKLQAKSTLHAVRIAISHGYFEA